MPTPSIAVVYEAIASTLRDFGYWDTDLHMIQEVHEAMLAGTELPHGLVGRFARDQIREVGLPAPRRPSRAELDTRASARRD